MTVRARSAEFLTVSRTALRVPNELLHAGRDQLMEMVGPVAVAVAVASLREVRRISARDPRSDLWCQGVLEQATVRFRLGTGSVLAPAAGRS